MKKFISALTSLAIATTALGGVAVMSADAADKTIIEFRSGDSNAIKAKAGDTVPVTVYVPQCTGANTFSLKMSINGSETLGKGVEETAEELELIKKEAANAKTAEDKAAYESVEHWLYGNYGIKTANEKFAKPYCFDSGIYQDGGGAGSSKLSYAYFLENTWNISLTLNTFVGENANADAYAPWKAAGEPDEYDDYTPVTKWTKDEAWAYDYALATFDLVLPDNLADGEYKLDLLTDKYINVVSHQFAQTSISGVDGAVAFESVPLVITVGEGKNPETTEAPKETDAPKTETTEAKTEAPKSETEAPKTESPASKEKPAPKEGTVQYDMIARDKENGFDGTNNTITAKPGEEITVDWKVKNDPGTAGMQMHFDFSDLTFKKRKAGDAYEVGVQWNKSTYAYVFASDSVMKAADDSVISTFTFTVPEKEGTYIITTKDTDGPCIVRPLLDEDPDIPVQFYGLAVTVGEPVGPGSETTAAVTEKTETTETTAAKTEGPANAEKPAPKAGTVQYDMLAVDKTNGFDGKNNTVTVKPGEDFSVQWVVSNDPGTAGMQMHFDFSDLTFKKRKAGDAYEVGVQWNKSTYAYVFASDSVMKAADGAVISTFTFTAPEKEGTYIITTKDTDGPCIVRPLLDEDPDIPVQFYGLAVTVGEPVEPGSETTAAVTEKTETTETTVTTTEAPTSETQAPATETQAPTTTAEVITSVLYGDVNLDGEIRIADVVILNKAVAGKIELNAQQKANADCVKDGKYTLDDSTAIKKYLAKLIPQSDLGKEA